MKTVNGMRKEINSRSLKVIVVIVALVGWVLVSCDPSNDFDDTTLDSQSAQLDAVDDLYQDDADDLANITMSAEGSSGGKTATDSRLECATITRTGSNGVGTVVIDFGNGCTGPRGHVRKGRIVIDYNGRYSVPGSTWTTRFEDYFFDDVKIEGTRQVANITEPGSNVRVFEVRMENGVMTWPDGTEATRRIHRIRHEERNENHILDRLIIYGTAEGNHRNGRGFYIEILEPLVYDRLCYDSGILIPVDGKKLIKHGEREITVEYGDGTCDNIVTITNKAGRSWEYTVGGN